MKKLIASLLCMIMLAALAAPLSFAAAEESAGSVQTASNLLSRAADIRFDPESYADILSDIPYLDDGESYHMLDLFGTQSHDAPTPTVVEVHGGGFVGGAKKNNIPHSVFFAERGFEVISTDYAKVPRHGDFIAAVQDLFATFHWVEAHAEEYHFDLDNMILSGDSAGGYYVLLVCALFHSQELRDYFGVTLPGFSFRTYVTTCPAADIMANREYYYQESGPNASMAQKIGAELLFDDELMAHMDLFTCVEAEAFEGLYMMTTPGDTVTGSDVLKFDAYLTKLGIEHVTMNYIGEENNLQHTFNISHADYAESKVANQDMVDYCLSRIAA